MKMRRVRRVRRVVQTKKYPQERGHKHREFASPGAQGLALEDMGKLYRRAATRHMAAGAIYLAGSASTSSRDGVGALFNNNACQDCHTNVGPEHEDADLEPLTDEESCVECHSRTQREIGRREHEGDSVRAGAVGIRDGVSSRRRVIGDRGVAAGGG